MFKKRILAENIRDNSGFSLIELMMMLAIIAILTQISFSSWIDYKRKAYDASAVSDARNLIEAVINDMVGFEDVDYSHTVASGSRIGAFDNEGNARPPSLFLSPGVNAHIFYDTVGGGIFVDAFIWHGGGSPDPTAAAPGNIGIREFESLIDEDNEVIDFVGFEGS